MLISTRGRYALRVLVDMAEHGDGTFLPLKDISERQEISKKYMEAIMVILSKAGLVEGVHGKGGGYRLTREPKDYAISEILELTEGTLAPVACVEGGENACPKAQSCRTVVMWNKLNTAIYDCLSSMSLADLMDEQNVG